MLGLCPLSVTAFKRDRQPCGLMSGTNGPTMAQSDQLEV